VFSGIADEETDIVTACSISTRQKFGEHNPLIRRQDVRGFVERKLSGCFAPARSREKRVPGELMEAESKRFYVAGGPSFVRCFDPPTTGRSRGRGEGHEAGSTTRISICSADVE